MACWPHLWLLLLVSSSYAFFNAALNEDEHVEFSWKHLQLRDLSPLMLELFLELFFAGMFEATVYDTKQLYSQSKFTLLWMSSYFDILLAAEHIDELLQYNSILYNLFNACPNLILHFALHASSIS